MHIDDHGMELKKILSYLTLLISFPVADFAESWTYTKSPESVTAPLNDTVVFTCQTNITADRVVWWHRHVSPTHTGPWTEVKLGNAKVRSSSGHRNAAKPNHYKLTVPFLNESLAGDYRCVSWFGASGLASVVAKLTKADLSGPPRHFENRHLNVAPDSYVLLRCPRPQSEPPATILYYEVKNDNSVLVNSIKDVGDALLVHARAGESKIYSCAAENPFAKNKRIEYHHRIKVDVQKNSPQIPTFTEDMLNKVIAKENETVTLGCAVIGFPAPEVTWRRAGGIQLPKHSSTEYTLLHIPKLQVQDRGEYICHASNSVGSTEKSIHLLVHQPPKLIPEEYSNIVQEGGTVRLPCGKKSGIPSPSLYWMINGVEVKNDSTVKVLEHEIEINPIEKRHAGLVQCFAVNSLGSVFSASLLQVKPKPQLSSYDNEKDFDSKKSGSSNGHKHRPRGRRVMIPPSQPHITRLSDESVMVRWTVESNNGLSIKFFKVQYRDLNQTSTRGEGGARWNTSVEEIPPHIRSYALDGLIPNHLYKLDELFRISAVYSNDDNKQGPNSSKFILLKGTDFIKTPPAPIFTHAEAISTTELLLHWELPTNISRDIPEPDGFYVYYRLSTNAGEYMKAAAEKGETRSQILGHLLPGMSYEIKLQSFTPMAASDFSQIIAQKTKKLPIQEKTDVTTIPTLGTSSGASNNNLRVYGIAGGAVGGMIILALLILAIILCKKRTGQPSSNKQDANIRSGGNSGSMTEGINGYLPSTRTKSGMTITPNPMPQESENINTLEMSSYISAQNNNCSAPSSRNSAELSPALASSCRDELRKQTPMSIPARENYV